MADAVKLQIEVLASDYPFLFETLSGIDNKHKRCRTFKNAAEEYLKAVKTGTQLSRETSTIGNTQLINKNSSLQNVNDIDNLPASKAIESINPRSIATNKINSDLATEIAESDSFDRWA